MHKLSGLCLLLRGGGRLRIFALIAGFIFGFIFWWILDLMGGDL